MTKKRTVRLTESDLKRVINESVKKVLKENESYVCADEARYIYDSIKNTLSDSLKRMEELVDEETYHSDGNSNLRLVNTFAQKIKNAYTALTSNN